MKHDNRDGLIAHFARLCTPLTPSEAAAATFDERVNSIGLLLVGRVLASHRRLSPEGKVAYDPDDLLLECWIKLRERNDKYQANRGTYYAFAQRIIAHCLIDLTEKTRCVKLPPNSAGLFNSLAESRDPADHDQLELLTRTARDHLELNSDVGAANARLKESLEFSSPLENMIEHETRAELREELAATLADNLSVVECLALGSYYGAWGNQRRSLRDVASDHGMSVQPLRRALVSARAKVKKAAGVN